MNKRNYQKELEELIAGMDGEKTLLLHCCCAPCSSYVLEYLHEYFKITVFFYNPNISEEDEYEKRKKELIRYIDSVSYGNEIAWLDADHEPDKFRQLAEGLESEPERGRRCVKCFELRLEETVKRAADGEYDYFCTTLSISPHKNADLLMQLGEELGSRYGISYLPSDFKKKNGYKRSIELSKEYDLYRQDYCGCIYSKNLKQEEVNESDD